MKLNEACMKKVRKPGYYKVVQFLDGSNESVWIENTMSDKCRSDMDVHKVKECQGCEQEQDLDYFKRMGLI